MSRKLFIFAGEKSGDLHGEKLVHELKKLDPNLSITGVGGPLMRAQGMECIMPMESFQVMGFIDVFLALPRLIRQFNFVASTILELSPEAVVFIDYPGFNLRMASRLRKRGYTGKLCHFICPSVWAWGKKRIPLMAKNLDLLLSILPFEKEYFKNTRLNVEYVGNPLVERLETYAYNPLNIPEGKKAIAIFCGSRKKEIERNLPLQLKVCRELKLKHPDLFFAVSISQPHYEEKIESIAQEAGFTFDLKVPPHKTYDLMKSAYAAIAKSGTVTLELALHKVPTVVTYGVSTLDYIIAWHILRIRLPFYCLANIVVGKRVFTELFGPNFTQENLLNAAESLISDPRARQESISGCQEVITLLGKKHSSEIAARHILDLLYLPPV